MLELGIFHNGASDLKTVTTPDSVTVTDGSVVDAHEAYQRILINQVRQGILAERLGYNYFFMTEHHFQPEGIEFSPNPLIAQSAIASRTNRIRLGQAANIITWWHPIRIAEQAAMLDVISGGRLEFGIGRGYQPREAETFGWPFGSTIQDQERNRAYYQEAYDLIIKAWTEPSFSHHGQFFTIPPVYTRWNHPSTLAYFKMPHAGRRLEEIVNLGGPDPYGGANPVTQTSTTLRELSVFPQPLQKPYPQMWEPLTTERSIRWAARHGINGYFVVEPNGRLRKNIDMYYSEAAQKGWPDRLNRGQFKYGWDCARRRGIITARFVHLLLPGMDRKKELERYRMALAAQWDYYAPFGFGLILADGDDVSSNPDPMAGADRILAKEVAIFGHPSDAVEQIMRIKQAGGYEDFILNAWFETNGFEGREVEDQMQYFAEEVRPLLARECGGQVENPVLGQDFGSIA
ncbi:MAG: LLM class flavin-dependent oxidoreductase [Candidatus Binataceae bacterium]|nr:LLM class flavin-dependent oxidoreductase [Candidatus Binataceae bacterium]